MNILKQCDDCGKVGPEEVVWWHKYEEKDLCEKCRDKNDLRSLQREHAKLKQWLEETHLGKLKSLEAEIAELEMKISNQSSPH